MLGYKKGLKKQWKVKCRLESVIDVLECVVTQNPWKNWNWREIVVDEELSSVLFLGYQRVILEGIVEQRLDR